MVCTKEEIQDRAEVEVLRRSGNVRALKRYC